MTPARHLTPAINPLGSANRFSETTAAVVRATPQGIALSYVEY
jgi:hypothetical protein